jgi:hypothetical protein
MVNIIKETLDVSFKNPPGASSLPQEKPEDLSYILGTTTCTIPIRMLISGTFSNWLKS